VRADAPVEILQLRVGVALHRDAAHEREAAAVLELVEDRGEIA
jgi:hypothetical protein